MRVEVKGFFDEGKTYIVPDCKIICLLEVKLANLKGLYAARLCSGEVLGYLISLMAFKILNAEFGVLLDHRMS
jgi:hypothetical protein